MRRAAPTALIVASLVVMSVLFAGVASELALARHGTPNLRVSLTSVLRADYSADQAGTTRAPLDGGILETARQDEDRLDETGAGIEIVQGFYLGGLPPPDLSFPPPTPTPPAPAPTPPPDPPHRQPPDRTPAPTPPRASPQNPPPPPAVTPACSPPDS